MDVQEIITLHQPPETLTRGGYPRSVICDSVRSFIDPGGVRRQWRSCGWMGDAAIAA